MNKCVYVCVCGGGVLSMAYSYYDRMENPNKQNNIIFLLEVHLVMVLPPNGMYLR